MPHEFSGKIDPRLKRYIMDISNGPEDTEKVAQWVLTQIEKCNAQNLC